MTDEHLLSLQPGTVIAGRYEVVKCLGAGSMGLVYACRHRDLSGHLVAVKVLFPEVAQDPVAAQRFKNEITASYGVSHPNVVRAYDLLRDGDILAYTMEFVGGGDLADRLGKKDALIPLKEAIKLLIQMCAGVQAIHDAGIIHRDLKPENILLTEDGNVKIADFGIARAGHGPKLTEHGGVVGTIDYVSPEYMLNSQVDWRSDLYAMGILAYEMLVGESPFRGDSVYETMTRRLKSDPKPPSELRKECPAELNRIVLLAMHREPEKRYQSALEMREDLEDLESDLFGSPERSGPNRRESGSNRRRGSVNVQEDARRTLQDVRSVYEPHAVVSEQAPAVSRGPVSLVQGVSQPASNGRVAPARNKVVIAQEPISDDTATQEISEFTVASEAGSKRRDRSAVKPEKSVEISQSKHEVKQPPEEDLGKLEGWDLTPAQDRDFDESADDPRISEDVVLLRRFSTFARRSASYDRVRMMEYSVLGVALIVGLGAGFFFMRYFSLM